MIEGKEEKIEEEEIEEEIKEEIEEIEEILISISWKSSDHSTDVTPIFSSCMTICLRKGF